MEQRLTQPAPFPAIKLILGVFLTALGVLLALDNLNVIDAHFVLRWWPLVLIAIGVARISDSTWRGPAIVAIVAGTLLLLRTTRVIHVSIFSLWPLLLIGAGVMIVAQAMGYSPARAGGWSAILSQHKIVVEEKNFTAGRAAVYMGGVELDLTKAEMANTPAVIEVFVLMGGMELRIPDGWRVVAEAIPFMGGIEIKTRSMTTGRELVLRGLVMMGGIEVKDVAARIA